jgi:Ser/Thr protein kinase RdoA (MazF antagonist)
VQTPRSRAHPQRTLVHGDLKAANMFFRDGSGDAGVEVGLIDFQWSGWGLGAVDLAYLMCAAVGPKVLDLTVEAAGETALLRHYHESLCAALAEFGAAPTAAAAAAELQPFDTLVAQYEAALLDHAVTVFSYQWHGLKAAPDVLDERGARVPTANAVNKNGDCGAWLLGRVARLLEKRPAA